MKNSAHHETNARSVISFLIVLLAFSILLIFYTNKDALMLSSNFPIFIALAALGLGLLAALLFLISGHHKHVTHKSSSRKKKKK